MNAVRLLAVARKVGADSATVARMKMRGQIRARTWLIGVSAAGFLLVTPFLLLGKMIVGENEARREAFLALSGYDNYVGFLAVPLVFAFLTSSAYGWIGQGIRREQQTGTLERTLISMQYPIALPLGGAIAHLIFLAIFIAIGISSLYLIADLNLNINWLSAIAVSLAHLYAVYGFAFLLSSLFLWIRDAHVVQQAISFVAIPLLSGAGFPITILPEWLQMISRAIPFTWAFALERRAFLQAASLGELAGDFLVLAALSSALWIIAYPMFASTLRHARRSGHLGLY